MAKTANLYVRIEPQLKEEAEGVLETLGLSSSAAVNLFYRQLVLQQALPFAVRIPTQKSVVKGKTGEETSTEKEENVLEEKSKMKEFIVVDNNVPMQFFGDCVGCVLDRESKDRVMILTAEGGNYPVAVPMLHFFAVQLYRKIMETWVKGGVLFIPDLSGTDDDKLRKVLMDLKVYDREEGMKKIADYMEEIKKL